MEEEKQSPIEIPLESLKPDLLSALMEEFVLREGTDYGHGEWSLDRKKEQVYKQLKSGRAKIFFDPELETCNIVTKEGAITC